MSSRLTDASIKGPFYGHDFLDARAGSFWVRFVSGKRVLKSTVGQTVGANRTHRARRCGVGAPLGPSRWRPFAGAWGGPGQTFGSGRSSPPTRPLPSTA